MNEETSMKNVPAKDKKSIRERGKNLFKKDLTGSIMNANEAANPAQQAAIAISIKNKGIKPKSMKEENLSEAPPKVPLKDTGNPVQNWWNRFVPPPESSNNPNVRSGLRQPGKLEKPGLDFMNQTAEKINKPIKIAGKLKKVGKFKKVKVSVIGKFTKEKKLLLDGKTFSKGYSHF